MIEAAVRAALDEIVDPCSAVAGAPAGLVQMGLVRMLRVTDAPGGAAVAVRIGVTEPGCLMGASFAAQARERLEALDGVAAVEIELDHAFDWEPGDIDPEYALRLESVRAARRTALASPRSGVARASNTCEGRSTAQDGAEPNKEAVWRPLSTTQQQPSTER